MANAPDGEETWFRLICRTVVQWGVASITLGLLAACGKASHDPATSAMAGAATQSSREEPVVNFANFIEEIAPETLPGFTRETGIAVNYDTYELNQVLESRLLVGSTGLDLVVPGNNYLERQIAAGVYRKLDKSRLPNLNNADPAILKLLESNDPGNQYAVPYVWGSLALGYDVAKVRSGARRTCTGLVGAAVRPKICGQACQVRNPRRRCTLGHGEPCAHIPRSRSEQRAPGRSRGGHGRVDGHTALRA